MEEMLTIFLFLLYFYEIYLNEANPKCIDNKFTRILLKTEIYVECGLIDFIAIDLLFSTIAKPKSPRKWGIGLRLRTMALTR